MQIARSLRTRAAAVVFVSSVIASQAAAHNTRADLAFWGNFGPDTAGCQSAISRAASLCVQKVISGARLSSHRNGNAEESAVAT